MPAEISGTVPTWPKWTADFRRLLPIRAQFVLSGNIRDVYLTPLQNGRLAPLPLLDCLWTCLSEIGFEWIAIYDRADMLRVHPAIPQVQQAAAKALNATIQNGKIDTSRAQLPSIIQRVVDGSGAARAAFVIDYASRMAVNAQSLSEQEHDFFVACEKLSYSAHPIAPKASEAGVSTTSLFNPLVWFVNRENDLPSWYASGNELIHAQVLGRPDFDTRATAAEILAPQFVDSGSSLRTVAEFAQEFAALTEGLSVRSMVSITQLARAQKIPMGGVTDAVRLYKVGLPDNPWKKAHIRTRIREAEAQISKRVKGQSQAVKKTIDILMRSVVGLTGAQSSSATVGRPRGTLFFAGPTGVGKTELAKSLTQLIFGDDKAYIRFDMSEFSAEHADARLLGAPPGYVGYDAGGELTNAIRERPFSVVLFDEIEKAHPRILDKFLQILEDGRLTDSRGETVYFSEAVLIFTSNLGIYVDDGSGARVQSVHPGEDYPVVEAKIRKGIEDHFKFALNRPEILNRFGDNIVIFNFITPDIAEEILGGMLDNVVHRVYDEQSVALEVPPEIRDQLRKLCASELSNGGRGIGNQLETKFINPLARVLFGMDGTSKGALTVAAITEHDGTFEVSLR